jgi:cytochrome c553
MRSHFKETREVRDAVIRGDLAATALPIEHMSAMAERDDVPEAWRTPLEHFRVVTRRLGRTSDIPGAAAAVADIGAACGSCHQTTGGPKPKLDAPPSATGTLAGRMQRHVWATERLWEGLYAPSDTSWKAGVDALSVEPFPKEVVERGGVHSRSYVTRFQTLVTTAATAQKVDDRAKVYASLLETCAACHKVTRPST